MSLSVSFINVCNFQSIGLSPCGYITSRYFILFDVIVSGIVFLTSVSDSLLLMYRKAEYFNMLILDSGNLLNSFISSDSFLVATLRYIVSYHLQILIILF